MCDVTIGKGAQLALEFYVDKPGSILRWVGLSKECTYTVLITTNNKTPEHKLNSISMQHCVTCSCIHRTLPVEVTNELNGRVTNGLTRSNENKVN